MCSFLHPVWDKILPLVGLCRKNFTTVVITDFIILTHCYIHHTTPHPPPPRGHPPPLPSSSPAVGGSCDHRGSVAPALIGQASQVKQPWEWDKPASVCSLIYSHSLTPGLCSASQGSGLMVATHWQTSLVGPSQVGLLLKVSLLNARHCIEILSWGPWLPQACSQDAETEDSRQAGEADLLILSVWQAGIGVR